MEKKFTSIQIAVIKRTAQNVASFTNKKEKLNSEITKLKESRDAMIAEAIKDIEEKIDKKIDAKIEKINAEIAVLQPMIDSFQGPIKEMTGGYTTEDLITREEVHTGKLSATGKEIVQSRFVLKYPETVTPPTTEEDTVEEIETFSEEASAAEESQDVFEEVKQEDIENPWA